MSDEPARLQPVEIQPAPSGFDPGRYLTKVGQNDYLEVKWRLVWLREVHPDAELETELVHFVSPLPHPETGEISGYALFRARVSIPGGGSATGFGHETFDDFRDYAEKAETKAIGRALAALGFGTQFAGDLEGGRADSPVDRSKTRGARQDRRGDGTDLAAWRDRVKQALAVEDPNLWQEVIKAAGKDPSKDTWRWLEIVAQLPTLDRLDRFSHFAADQGMLTSAVESKIANRKKDLGRVATR